MTMLEKAIRLRSMMDDLTKQELLQFMKDIVDENQTHVIKTALFNHFIPSSSCTYTPATPNCDNTDLDAMNSTLSCIIESRTVTQMKPITSTLDKLPSTIIGHTVSFLQFDDYVCFQRCNRSIFIGCNSTNPVKESYCDDAVSDPDSSSSVKTEDNTELFYNDKLIISADGTSTCAQYGEPEEESCPQVIRVDIDGKWYNKKTRLIIEYRGNVFGRKETDFKWLHKMIEVNDNSGVIPCLCHVLPTSLWSSHYLVKRKKELNVFLMECHALKNIKNSEAYHIFLEQHKVSWKQRRNQFDKMLLEKIKRDQFGKK
eukprot:154460_1